MDRRIIAISTVEQKTEVNLYEINMQLHLKFVLSL